MWLPHPALPSGGEQAPGTVRHRQAWLGPTGRSIVQYLTAMVGVPPLAAGTAATGHPSHVLTVTAR